MKIDQSTARAMNRRSILNLLRMEGAMSRAEVAQKIGLSPATVTFVINDMIAEGLVVEGIPASGGAGRKRVPIEINYGGLRAVGLKLMVGAVECVVTDLSTNPLERRTLALPDRTPQSVVSVCTQLVQELLIQSRKSGVRITGVGVSMPGVIHDGICRRSNRFDWTEVPIGQMLGEALRLPVWVEDDTNAFALAQQLFRLGRNHRLIGALGIGAGIACSIVIDGSVNHGANGAAGKLGHSVFDPQGEWCECGRRGCLQAHYSEPAMVRRWRKATGSPENFGRVEMAEAGVAGDPVVRQILGEAGEAIGRALGTFCNIVDPEIIVVGGEAVAFGDHLFQPMRDSLKRSMMWTPPPLVPDWIDNSWAQGAAALATRHVFDFQAFDGVVVD